MQISNKKEPTGQRDILNVHTYSLRRKGAPRSVIELSPVIKEIKRLKKSLMLNEIKAHIFEFLITSEWHYLRIIRRCCLVGACVDF